MMKLFYRFMLNHIHLEFYLLVYFMFLYIYVHVFTYSYLFIYVESFLYIYVDSNTFKDFIPTLAIEMYMITCLMHAFSSTIYDTHANTWSEPDETGKLVTISKNSVHHFQKRCISLLQKQ